MKIKIVDGFKIRNTIDPDFGDLGEHFVFPWIPKGEIWVDKNYKSEFKFNFKVRTQRNKLLKQGLSFEEAKETVRRLFRKDGIVVKKIKLLKMLKNSNGAKKIKVWLVDGEHVRKNLDPFFVMGGHGYVYSYIPKDEIWIDDKVQPKERKYIIIHEMKEREFMRRDKDKDFYRKYANAHDFATVFEKQARRKDGVAKYLSD